MEKLFKAYVKCKESKEFTIIESKYEYKKDFKNDLENNGYIVYVISTPDSFDNDCKKYEEKREQQKRKQKTYYEIKKAHKKYEETFKFFDLLNL